MLTGYGSIAVAAENFRSAPIFKVWLAARRFSWLCTIGTSVLFGAIDRNWQAGRVAGMTYHRRSITVDSWPTP